MTGGWPVRLAAPLAVSLAAVAVSGAGGCGDESPWECIVPEGTDATWTRRIGCDADYELLWAERDDAIFAHTAVVNWLIDREDGDRIYFIDSVTFPLHFDFAAAYLNQPDLTPVGTHAEFNLLNYRRENRRFVLGQIIHYRDQGLLTFEMSPGDTAAAPMVVDAFRRIAGAVFDGDRLRYRPVSAAHEELVAELSGQIPIVRTEEVISGQTYQPLNAKVGFGTLRFVPAAGLAGAHLLPTDIVVLDRVPNDISMVSGIITAEFQTPLAHVNILAKNRGTPNMALRDAFGAPALRAYEGQLVRLEVTPQEYSIGPGDPAAAQQYWASLRPSQPLVPTYDLSVSGLVDLAELDYRAAPAVGAKAANLAETLRLNDGAIPGPDAPFAVPVYYYDAHLAANSLNPVIDQLLADAPSLDPVALEQRLFALRWAIYQAPLDPALRAALVDEVAQRWGADRKIRFRSSTNAEDLAEFTGAGLYTSASARLSEGEERVEEALKVVWASAWNYQAFVERDFYRVDHRAVRMAVLVHPSFESERANGVAVTINEFTQRRPAYYINSQVGDISVTNPTGVARPEQVLYYTWYEEPEVEVIARSSLAGGAPVLSAAELDELAAYLEAIHNHFRSLLGGGASFAMDIEFRVTDTGQLAIKQARPLRRR